MRCRIAERLCQCCANVREVLTALVASETCDILYYYGLRKQLALSAKHFREQISAVEPSKLSAGPRKGLAWRSGEKHVSPCIGTEGDARYVFEYVVRLVTQLLRVEHERAERRGIGFHKRPVLVARHRKAQRHSSSAGKEFDRG
jgi:hypothetical protein